jgi:monoamine oxidase
MMDRRRFLQAGLGTAGALLAGAYYSPAQTVGPKYKVLIVGAGLSGLGAGYRLRQLGHDVRIFEARERPGGRIQTLRDFTHGKYADAGAARIPQNHNLTHDAVREFGLSLADFYPTTGKFVKLTNGRAEYVGWDKFADATDQVMSLERPERWKRIVGGTDQLPKAIARSLQKHIVYNSPVSAISTDPRGVTVKLRGGDSVNGDAVICAVPLPLLRGIQFTPLLSSVKQRLIDNAKYAAVVRVFFETRDRFWTKQDLNGFGFGEKYDEVWDSSFGQPGPGGILQSYNREPFATSLTQMAEPDRHNLVATSMEKLFPDVRSNTLSTQSKCWALDPWSKGAWGELIPDQKRILSEPENRIFFAGEHLSEYPSWIQGALQSANKVVEQVSGLGVSSSI